MQKKKIVVLDNSLGFTGAFKAILTNAIYLKDEFDFVFILPKNNDDEEAKEAIKKGGFPLYKVPFKELSRKFTRPFIYPFYLLLTGYLVAKIAKKENASIVHVNDIYNLSGLVAKLFCKISVVTHIRRMPEQLPMPLWKLLIPLNIKFGAYVFPVSIANAKIFNGSPKAVVIYDQLPEETIPYIQRETKDIREERINMVCLANYTHFKGHLQILETIVLMKKKYGVSNFTVNFYGADYGLPKNIAYKESLKEYVMENRIDEHVSFYGYASDVKDLYIKNDIALNFSECESFSRFSLESLLYGTPLIATDVGGTNEMFVDGESGYLVKNNDIEQMALKLNNLLNDVSLRKKFSEKSQAYVRVKFSDKNTVGKMLDIYNELI